MVGGGVVEVKDLVVLCDITTVTLVSFVMRANTGLSPTLLMLLVVTLASDERGSSSMVNLVSLSRRLSLVLSSPKQGKLKQKTEG